MVTGVNWMPFQLAKNTPFCGDQGHIAHVSAFQKLRTELQWLSGEDHFQRPFKRYGRPSWEPRYHQHILKMGVWGKNRGCCYPGKMSAAWRKELVDLMVATQCAHSLKLRASELVLFVILWVYGLKLLSKAYPDSQPFLFLAGPIFHHHLIINDHCVAAVSQNLVESISVQDSTVPNTSEHHRNVTHGLLGKSQATWGRSSSCKRTCNHSYRGFTSQLPDIIPKSHGYTMWYHVIAIKCHRNYPVLLVLHSKKVLFSLHKAGLYRPSFPCRYGRRLRLLRPGPR